MIHALLKKTLILLQLGAILFYFWPTSQTHAVVQTSNLTDETLISSSQSYQSVYQKWIEDGLDSPFTSISFGIDDMVSESDLVIFDEESTFLLHKHDTIMLSFDIEVEGLYEVWIDYAVGGNRSINPIISKEIKHEDSDYTHQYNEDMEMRLEIVWEKEELLPSIDRYGDEIAIRSINTQKWLNDYRFYDPAKIVKDPLKNYFDEGLNTIKIEVLNSVTLYINKITISNSNALPSYEAYLNNLSDEQQVRPSETFLHIASEDYTFLGNTNIIRSSIMKPHMTKYQFNKRFINAITLEKAGQWIEYDVEVEQQGLYKLAIKGEITKIGLPVYRKISINGEVPFDVFNHLEIPYKKGWSNHVLGADTPYEVYLKPGKNTIRIEASPGLNAHFVALQSVLNDIQALNMEITSLTGGQIDTDRTWKMETYIPDIKPRLESMSKRLFDEHQLLSAYSSKGAPQFNVLVVAAEQLQDLSDDPDELIEKLYLLNVGSSSSASLISTVLSGMLDEPMTMDAIYLFTDHKLPKASSPWYVNLWQEIKMFVFSFFDPRYDIELSSDPEVVKVWVRKSKLHVDLMQRMTDEMFTSQTGIEVELIVLQNESRIVLANAAGKTPDVALSIGNVFDYASRGMLADMRVMDGFQASATEFNPNSFVPYIYEEGVYAMPETQDVALLYYRKDILSSLDISVPETWDDVLRMLPLLQSLGMNFYHPISGLASTKSINHMSPLIYQYGGEFYGETAQDIKLRDPKTVESIKFMIDLYNIYNLPLQIGSFYERFRNGTLPIGISDQNMYIQLKYAAPEIIGQWGVAPIPGILNDEDVIERWDTALGSASIIFESSENKDNAWEFIKWWVSKDIQSEFSHELITNFGDLFLYMTANIEGFVLSSWPEDSKDAILSQWDWIRIPPRLPGYYMLERELSNVYNDAVFQQVSYRRALDEAYFNLEREINRKLEEFGFSSTNPYRIPNNSNIHEWIGA